MKTIWITSFHVLISRNILASDCFRVLAADPDIRIVLFVSDYKQAYFVSTFGNARTTVVGVPLALGRFDRIMREFVLLLVAPTGDRYIRRNVTDRAVLEALASGRASGALPANLQVLVRLPPTDTVNLEGFVSPAWMKIERPGVSFRPGAVKEAELSPDDDKRLADSLASSDVLITGPSTMAIDAARFAVNNDLDQRPSRFYH